MMYYRLPEDSAEEVRKKADAIGWQTVTRGFSPAVADKGLNPRAHF